MKKFMLIVAIALIFVACNNSTSKNTHADHTVPVAADTQRRMSTKAKAIAL
ncbi:hypothetical protein ACR784_22020 [Sphingobacterium multivorum]|uniref:hypothetical protein n=1 Tax=Sphingobacterium multivorum TaxID=28454 RepID=UPI003DA349E5